MRYLGTYTVQCGFVAIDTQCMVVRRIDGHRLPLWVDQMHVLECAHLLHAQHRALEVHTIALLLVHLEQVALRTDVLVERHYNLLSNRVNRRVRHLCKQLTEVLVDETGRLRHASEWCIATHTAEGLLCFVHHGKHEHVDLIRRVAKGTKARVIAQIRVIQLHSELIWHQSLHRLGDGLEFQKIMLDPGSKISEVRRARLQFTVVNDTALLRVDKKHAARAQATLGSDGLGGNRNATHL